MRLECPLNLEIYFVGLDMPHIRFRDLRYSAAPNMYQLTGDFYTLGEVFGHTFVGIGASLGLSMNLEAVTDRYADVRLERKKEVPDSYHNVIKQINPAAKDTAISQKRARAKKAQEWSCDGRILLQLPAASYLSSRNVGTIGDFQPTSTGVTRSTAYLHKHSVYAGLRCFIIWCPDHNHAR